AGPLRQHAPVGAELERHDDAGHDPHAERHREHLEPEVEHPPIEGVTGGQPRALDGREPRRQPDRERREDDVKADDKRELEARQECWIELHGRCRPNGSFESYQRGGVGRGSAWRGPHWLPEAPSKPSTTIFAVTIFFGQTGCVKPVATATFCAP